MQTGREKFQASLKYRMSPKEIRLVMLAYKLSKYAHRNQTRKDGTRYFEHPKRVAISLIEEFGICDYQMIVAALLHDVPEDSFMLDVEDIELIFGERCARMVDLLTKKKGVPFDDYIKRLVAGEEGAQIVKLADRLDNIRDTKGCSKEKIEKYLEETQQYFLEWEWSAEAHPLMFESLCAAVFSAGCQIRSR